jgi:hypothetical protein
MKLDTAALEDLRRICAESFQTTLSEVELQDMGQRILRFLKNSHEQAPDEARNIDPDLTVR